MLQGADVVEDLALYTTQPCPGPLGSGASPGSSPPARRRRLRQDQRAVAAIEYAVMAGILVFAVYAATGPFASGLSLLLTHIGNAL